MKNIRVRCGSYSKSNAYALIIAALAFAPSFTAFGESLSNNSEVNGNFTVGTTTAKGNLTVNAPVGTAPDLTVLGLQVNSGGGVFFAASSGSSSSVGPSVNSGFYFCAFDTAIQLGNFFVGANGWASISSGYYSVASGSESIAIGYQNQASGYTSVAFGNQSVASGTTSAAFGYATDATGSNSFSAGDFSLASGVSTFAAGTGVTANSLSSAVVGAFNKVPTASATAWVDADPLFTIGNGTADNQRSNALMVQKDGIVNLYPFGSTSASIVLNPKGTPSITVGGQSVLTANSSSNFAFTGNLGVGNSGATTAHGDADNVVVGSTTGSNGLTIFGESNGRSNIFFGNASSPYAGVLSYNHQNGKLQIGGNAYDASGGLYLQSNGNLGIGTSSPTAQVHVYSTVNSEMRVQTTGTSNAATAGVNLIGGNAGADWWMLTNRADLASAANSLAFFKGTGTVGTKMVITDGGNVGIATTTPNASYRLDVNGYSGLGGLRVNGNDESNTLLSPTGKQIAINAVAGNGVTVKTTGAVVVGAWNDAAQQKFNVVGKSYFSDNVGIGTTSPSAKLEVAGTVKFAKQGDIPMGEFGLSGD